MADRVLELLAPVQAALEASPLAVKVSAAIGCLVLSRLALQLLGSLYTFFLRPAKSLKSFGQWGVVTGATDGIGKALAMELARKGMNVVLLSRTQSRLEAARDEILAKYPKVQVEILAVDFNRVDEPSVREALQKKIDQVKDVGVLFNNVGVSYDFPEFFDQLDEDRVDSLIKLNVAATTIMTKIVIPGMAQRKRGVIVNLSSGSGRMVVPLLSEYSATKKYVEQLTLCLAAEYAAKNVHVQCHVPMFVSTKLAKIRHSSFMVPSPATYARASVAHLGYDTLISPYWPHALQIWLYESAPTWLLAKGAMMTHMSLRKRALKKLEAKKNQ
ncbi:Very-long-chain 3-oxoacyl-CoA reductase 1 [Phytophthora citrophthora]|uniref:Very-long-chain 3-oxoacyl-CoA reductase 1 n=1 Tax=Phytophthora citrophthora TaxID=4793 RepID=A0AAD9GVD9_9STRA|nr:Very-long-chain 3-oxoacyl-CoA reductase 1 [Phytophthora citrophthora]